MATPHDGKDHQIYREEALIMGKIVIVVESPTQTTSELEELGHQADLENHFGGGARVYVVPSDEEFPH